VLIWGREIRDTSHYCNRCFLLELSKKMGDAPRFLNFFSIQQILLRKEKKMKVTKSIFWAMLLLVPLSVFAVDFSNVPLPDDLNIVSPDPSLPENIKALSGKRGGEWKAVTRFAIPPIINSAVLVVEKILDEKTAVIVYGASESSKSKAHFYRTEAQIISSGKKVKLEWVSPVTTRKTTFRLRRDSLESEEPVSGLVETVTTINITMSRIQ
jgi:hypothetical protein